MTTQDKITEKAVKNICENRFSEQMIRAYVKFALTEFGSFVLSEIREK